MKKIVKTQIKSKDSIKHYESKAIINQNIFKYKEDDVIVCLEIYDDYLVLKRHNNDFNYVFTFKNNKSKLEYNLKNYNYNFNIDFKTKKLLIDDNKILVSYILEGIEYCYEVIIGEEL